MNTNESKKQNRSGCIKRENADGVTREEMKVRLEMKELAITRLRRRVSKLEEQAGVEDTGKDEICPKEHERRADLDALQGDRDE